MIGSAISFSSASSARRKEGGSPSCAKPARTSSPKNASMVEICALPSESTCRERWEFSGSAASASPSAFAIRLFSSAAAARVKVTIRSLESSAGCSGSVSIRMMRSVRTLVFPDPAAAETTSSRPRSLMASSCDAVHVLAICSPFVKAKTLGRCPKPHLGDFLRKKSPKNLQDLQPICIFDSLFTLCRF